MAELEDSIKTIKENLDIFGVGRGIKSRYIIEDFFKEKYGIDTMPSSIIDFYTHFDGIAFSTVGNVYSVIENECVEDYESSVTSEHMSEFIEAIGLDNEEYKFFFIGNDGMGGYYAVRTNTEDDRVYWLDHEFPDKFKEVLLSGNFDNELIFENFVTFLDRMLEDTIEIEREEEQDF